MPGRDQLAHSSSTDPRETRHFDPAQLSLDNTASLRRSFIQCTKAPFFSEAAERAKREGFRFRELFVAGHDAMITEPQALASILMDFL